MPKKVRIKNVIAYVLFGVGVCLTNCVIRGVPISACLLFAMLVCGGNIPISAVIYVAMSAINGINLTVLCAVSESVFLSLMTFIYRFRRSKLTWEGWVYLIIALTPFILLSSFNPFENISGYATRAVITLICIPILYASIRAINALIFRIARCRLREDEYFCIALIYCICAIGFINLFGLYSYYMAMLFFAILCVRALKSPLCLILCTIFSIPACILTLSLTPLATFTLITILTLLFCNLSPFFPAAIACTSSLVALYIGGNLYGNPSLIIIKCVIVFAILLLSCSIPEKLLINIKSKILFQTTLYKKLEDEYKENLSQRLFKISDVFREIEHAFLAMDEVIDERATRMRMLSELKKRCCTSCDKAGRCSKSNVYVGFSKLMGAGCVKGKVSLIDIPTDISLNCSKPTLVIEQLNALLVEYRRHMIEVENVRSGRLLLANQSHGICEVIRECAIDCSKKGADYTPTNALIQTNLATVGITCSEVEIVENQSLTVNAVIIGKANSDYILRAIERVLKKSFMLSDKLVYDDIKTRYVFSEKPKLDATFGVAFKVKEGERFSGDTHTVIKLNNYTFLMVLSDGMGSGEYAKKISSTAISLIEAFYKAGMPRRTILETINKLISFSRDERFTCIDIGAINLKDGIVDFVKIGSPVSLIIGNGKIRLLNGNSLPLGILDSLKPTVCSENVADGDTIVFMSDGITSAFGSDTDLNTYLQKLSPLNPQKLADDLLAQALKLYSNKAEDDMTVLAVRMFSSTLE